MDYKWYRDGFQHTIYSCFTEKVIYGRFEQRKCCLERIRAPKEHIAGWVQLTGGFSSSNWRSPSHRYIPDISRTGQRLQLSFHASIGVTNWWYALQISRQCLVTLLCNEHIIHSVLQILHVEPHVFVSLHNGALVVYTRDKQGLWDMENYQLIVIDTTGENYHLFLLFRYLDTTYSLPDYHLCRGIWRMGITTVRYFPRMRIFLALWVVLVSTD